MLIDIFKQYQIDILMGCGMMCLLMSFFVMHIRFTSVKKKSALILIQLGVMVLLISDAFAYIYRGNTSTLGCYMTRISNFLVFIFTLLNIYFFTDYVMCLFQEKGRYDKSLPIITACKGLLYLGLAFVVVSQFNGMYYSFNAENLYERGPLFAIGFIFPFGVLSVLFVIIIKNRKLLKPGIFFSVILYSVLPFTAAVVQLFLYGLSLINLSTWAAAVTLFWIALSDQNTELERAAAVEVMTGLPNTFGFTNDVEDVINFRDITEYDGVYFDIVRMGQINNRYGKAIGDEIIVKYAHAIKKSIEKDEILGRFGGNYFVALIKKTNIDAFANMLKSVPIEIEYLGQNETVNVSAIVGAYDITTKEVTAEQILGNCAAAVNYAKNNYHKQFMLMDESFEAEFRRMRQVEENAMKGIENEEFEPFYQPKVDSVGNVLCGAEALVRWRRDGVLVPPFQFIPVLEKNNIICNIDFYMLEHVCMDIKEWIRRGIEPVPVSVNFSRRNLGNPILSQAISDVVDKYEIPKDLIQVEITESLDEYPMSYLKGVVEALHDYGLTAAIDDFGTGSSSIMVLKVVPFDELKIDKAFSDYKDDKEKQILRDIIQLANNIGIGVIAEGVEQAEQVEVLKAMGCTHIQGYYYDKPMEKHDFEKRLLNKNYDRPMK